MVDERGGIAAVTDRVIEAGRQFNPEFIVNIDAGAIILFQMLVSFGMGRFHRFTTMIAGMCVAAVGIGLSAFAGGEGMLGVGSGVWLVCLGLLIFAFGEMMASPTSQEYVGRIAPRNKVALYMGYYFVAIALGYLFGGILSGQLYGKLAPRYGAARPHVAHLRHPHVRHGLGVLALQQVRPAQRAGRIAHQGVGDTFRTGIPHRRA